MIKTRRAAAAVACAAGVTAGLIGMSAPAYATGTGTATYNCSYTDPNPPHGTININGVTTTWQHGASGNLTIKSSILAPQNIAAHGIYTMVGTVKLDNAAVLNTGDQVNLGPSVVSGTISGPPSTLTIQIVGPPAVTVTCVLQNPPAPTGWPI